MSNIDETVAEFLVESIENLDHLDRALIVLEESPADSDVINQIFRIVHTIKGTCGFFDFKNLESISHVGENLLDSVRSNQIQVSPDIITALLALSDSLRSMIVNIEHSGNEGTEDYSELRDILTELNKKPAAIPVEENRPTAPIIERTVKQLVVDPSEDDELEKMFLAASDEYRLLQQIAEEMENDAQSHPTVVQSVAMGPEVQEVQEMQSKPVPGVPNAPKQNENKKSDLADSALRVDVALLDKLMNLVGELVLARNQILQFTKNQNQGDSDFVSTSQRLNLITSELQEGVMRTRMQPIANVWNKLPRIVRDVAASCGKQVNLEMYGKETELDKTIIEAIKDPLTHIIRNAVDHGIENPQTRVANGKSPEGILIMRAFHEGGQVIIEISDNGSGLNVERIRSKAIERGIITTEKAASMSEQEVQRLIFLPGFSTAEKITNISGRGVGMDVVRSNIEKIGGTIDVSSKLNSGTVFTIKIPLTLAIIPALIVTAADNRYAIPQVNLLELVRIEGEQIKNNLEEIEGAVFYRLRGKLLPIIKLRSELDLGSVESQDIKNTNVMSIVVVKADNLQFGLVVDAIFDTEEIVVKPLGKLLKSVPAFAGATIMGDGRVALILDVAGLAKKAQITQEDSVAQEDVAEANENIQDRKKLLIFQVTEKRRAAIQLDQVHRLEEFETSKLEIAAHQTVVQYRGGILPLIDLHQSLNGTKLEYNGSVRAFVHFNGQRYVGFVVKNIVDIVEQAVKVESPYKRNGLLGSAIIQGVVTDLVDLPAVIDANDYFDGKESACTN